MITIDDLYDSEFVTKDFSNRLHSLDDHLYPMTHWISYKLLNKSYSYFKTFSSENKSSELTFDFHKNLNNQLTFDEYSKAEEFIVKHSFSPDADYAQAPYIFFGSKNFLKQQFFPDYMPSAYNHLISHLIDNDYIKIIGPGHGSFILFNFSKFHTPILISSPQDLSYFQNSISTFVSQYNQLKYDNSYLLDLLSEKDELINSLLLTVKDLEYKNYIQTQMTWN